MSLVVEQQDEVINVIETQAAAAEKDVETGFVIYVYQIHLFIDSLRLQYTEKAVVSARSARKKRWICFWITFVLLIIIALILALVIYKAVHKTL